MTIAERVIGLSITAESCTFYGGYAVIDGKLVSFPTGFKEAEKRGKNGHLMMERYRYADNSVLEVHWDDVEGRTFNTY
jgi:predicted SnoaL-like aldol condensation-catalyzing enzyme